MEAVFLFETSMNGNCSTRHLVTLDNHLCDAPGMQRGIMTCLFNLWHSYAVTDELTNTATRGKFGENVHILSI
jgi:hypothetical protein